MDRQHPDALKWWLPGGYLAVMVATVSVRGATAGFSEATIIAYVFALPLSVFSFGLQSFAAGYVILGVAAAVNVALLYAIGAMLAERSRRHADSAA